MRVGSGLLLLFLTANATPAEENSYRDSRMHYHVRIPAGWRAVTVEEFQQGMQSVQEILGVSLKYDTWFQKREKTFGDYPYILVSHQECDMPTLEVVAKGLREKRSESDAPSSSRISKQVSGVEMRNIVVDPVKSCVKWEVDMKVALNNTGAIHGQAASFPGKQGVVNFICYSRSGDFHQDVPPFQELLNSFMFEEGFGYEAGLAEKRNRATPLEGLLLYFAAGMILLLFGCFLAFVIFRLRTKRWVTTERGDERHSR